MPPMCKYRGPLLLHAAQSWHGWAVDWMLERGLLTDDQRRGPFLAYSRDATHPPGVIFARCCVVAHVEPGAQGAVVVFRAELAEAACPIHPGLVAAGASASSHVALVRGLDLRWWMGGYALVLADVEPTPLVACKGSLGLWTPDEDTHNRLGLSLSDAP